MNRFKNIVSSTGYKPTTEAFIQTNENLRFAMDMRFYCKNYIYIFDWACKCRRADFVSTSYRYTMGKTANSRIFMFYAW